jgi:hydroxymethylglutaryl-CoA reductase (NADPH)
MQYAEQKPVMFMRQPSIVLKDGMTRAPAVRFPSARHAAELKAFLEDPANFDTLAMVFNR